MLLLACAQKGISVDGFAPDVNQSFVTNHLTQEKSQESRNVLSESARIVRGNAKSLHAYDPNDYDALLFPGGFGAVTNLCGFGLNESVQFGVNSAVEKAVRDTYAATKPMAFLCISPMLAGQILGSHGVQLTIGTDEHYLGLLREMGADAISVPSRSIVWDEKHKVGSSPAYMLAKSIEDVYVEAVQLVDRLFA